ncbi:hypothetical protein AIOL_002199 [Candidatus Rhodobacter oscarellae]|uniref:Uncharacterized protein n=1 Tax=Candidatus Rhodobacter oscarellae TaxID=1675527 RepID=A0A0J9GUH5_9RHOB|nr:hypothetical protein AIOL_002199 [Candidatus Rhodobacter lobularis]
MGRGSADGLPVADFLSKLEDEETARIHARSAPKFLGSPDYWG